MAAKSDAGDADTAWVPATDGYEIALEGAKLVCRNARGRRLKSAPAKVRKSDAAADLRAVAERMGQHEQECAQTAELWMLRSLPAPRAAFEQVWPDPSWRRVLRHCVVVPVGDDGGWDLAGAGFLMDVDADRGIGVVDVDGESLWTKAPELAVPHPIVLEDLDGWRELAAELDLRQEIDQLFRTTHIRPTELADDANSVLDFEGGKFEQLLHAQSRARSQGFAVRGGFAECRVFEGGRITKACFWIGSDDPSVETYTGELLWVDENEERIDASEIGPIAWSEGVRMATAIYSARVVEEEPAR